MTVVTVSPLSAATFATEQPNGASTVVIKATYAMRHQAVAQLASEPLALFEEHAANGHPNDFTPTGAGHSPKTHQPGLERHCRK